VGGSTWIGTGDGRKGRKDGWMDAGCRMQDERPGAGIRGVTTQLGRGMCGRL